MTPAIAAARVTYVGYAGVAAVIAVRSFPDAALSVLVTGAGVLALAAAADLRSEHPMRGAVASIGIVVGSLPVAVPITQASFVMAYFGAWTQVGLTGIALLLVAVLGIVMWRGSRRPWDRAQPATAR